MCSRSRLCSVVVFIMSLVATSWAGTVLESVNDFWIRQRNGAAYDNDGISVWNGAGSDRRYGLVEFDVSGLGSLPVTGATLELYSAVHAYSDYKTPIKQTTYMIDGSTGTPLADLNWATYMAEKDAGKMEMGTLGRYDLPAASEDPAQQNAYMPSIASAADVALIQNAINAGRNLCLVMIAEESETLYTRSWGDGDSDWSGGAGGVPRLVLSQADGRAYFPDPFSGQELVPPTAALSWQVYLPVYSETPSYKVYLSADADPNFTGVVPVTTAVTSYDPPADLDYETTYYWRVDVVDPNHGVEKVYKGDTWSFTTGPHYSKPGQPSPGNEATDVAADAVLSWESDSGALTHEVYLGGGMDDWRLVAEIEAPGATEYTFSGKWDTPYEWQVVDVFPGGVVLESDVWTFRTATPTCNGGERLAGDEDGDCLITLSDLAIMAANWLECGWQPAEACGQWPPAPPQGGVTTDLEVWIRQRAANANSTYENDGMTLYNDRVPEGRRAALMDFDLGAYQGQTITGARLWLWQVGDWDSIAWPCQTHAYVVDPNLTPTNAMTWNSYMSEYAGTVREAPLETLGVYDLGADVFAETDTYVGSLPASAADLALIQAKADAGGVLTISLWADDGPTQFRVDFADDVNFGYRAFLQLDVDPLN